MALFGRRTRRDESGQRPAAGAPTAVAGLDDLHDIAARGTAEDVARRVAAGDDVNARNRVGYTPLGIAASRGDLEVARALLDAGAEVDPVDNTGGTPLAAAVLNARGRSDMIELLLARGADAHRPNQRGQSPLDLAQRTGSADVVLLFERA